VPTLVSSSLPIPSRIPPYPSSLQSTTSLPFFFSSFGIFFNYFSPFNLQASLLEFVVAGDPLANADHAQPAKSSAGSGQAEARDDDLFDFLDDHGSTGFGLASNAAGLARRGGAVGSGGGGGAADQHANYLDR
jgi:hypothetical protein